MIKIVASERNKQRSGPDINGVIDQEIHVGLFHFDFSIGIGNMRTAIFNFQFRSKTQTLVGKSADINNPAMLIKRGIGFFKITVLDIRVAADRNIAETERIPDDKSAFADR